MQYNASSLPWVLNTCDNPGGLSEMQGFYSDFPFYALSLCSCGCAGSKSLGAGCCVWLMSNNKEVRPFVTCAIRLL